MFFSYLSSPGACKLLQLLGREGGCCHGSGNARQVDLRRLPADLDRLDGSGRLCAQRVTFEFAGQCSRSLSSFRRDFRGHT